MSDYTTNATVCVTNFHAPASPLKQANQRKNYQYHENDKAAIKTTVFHNIIALGYSSAKLVNSLHIPK